MKNLKYQQRSHRDQYNNSMNDGNRSPVCEQKQLYSSSNLNGFPDHVIDDDDRNPIILEPRATDDSCERLMELTVNDNNYNHHGNKKEKIYQRQKGGLLRTRRMAVVLGVSLLVILHFTNYATVGVPFKLNNNASTSKLIGIQQYNFTKSKLMPTEPRIFFVHIGKAGGVSLYDTLRIRTGRVRFAPSCRRDGLMLPWGNDNSCYRSFPKEQVLARHIVGHTHLHSKMYSTIEKEWMLYNSNMFLYTIRDLIDRIISAYNYHQARETHHRFYQTCFPDGLDTLTSVLNCKGDTESLMKCRDLGLNTLQGNSPDVGQHQENLRCEA